MLILIHINRTRSGFLSYELSSSPDQSNLHFAFDDRLKLHLIPVSTHCGADRSLTSNAFQYTGTSPFDSALRLSFSVRGFE
jgi:hypothetical protein